jgi:hypothetical protein
MLLSMANAALTITMIRQYSITGCANTGIAHADSFNEHKPCIPSMQNCTTAERTQQTRAPDMSVYEVKHLKNNSNSGTKSKPHLQTAAGHQL